MATNPSTWKDRLLLAIVEVEVIRRSIAAEFRKRAELEEARADHVRQRMSAEKPWCVSSAHDVEWLCLMEEITRSMLRMQALNEQEDLAYRAYCLLTAKAAVECGDLAADKAPAFGVE